MKVKRILMSVLLAMLTFFSGCFDKTYSYELEELRERVVGVEIVYVHYNSIDGSYENLEQEVQIVYVLQESEISSFLEDFSKIVFFGDPKNWSEASKYSVKLIYTDNSFLIQGAGSGAEYTAKGKLIGYLGCVDAESRNDFYRLMLKYLIPCAERQENNE